MNFKFIKKNALNEYLIRPYSGKLGIYSLGILLGILLILTIWGIVFIIYPYKITTNTASSANLFIDLIDYTLGNALEEFIFRGFLLLAFISLFAKPRGIFLLSLLFGLFHLPGLGITWEGLAMVLTTSSMSLLLICIICLTQTIWTGIMLHITANLLLHSVGFDGTNHGLLLIRFNASEINEYILTFVYEITVITFAIILIIKNKNSL